MVYYPDNLQSAITFGRALRQRALIGPLKDLPTSLLRVELKATSLLRVELKAQGEATGNKGIAISNRCIATN